MRGWFALASVLCLAALLALLGLPLAALALRVPPGDLIAQLGSDTARDALAVSLKTSLAAHVLLLLAGTPAAYLVARTRFRGRSAVIALTELPLVLPPVVAGIALLAAFGRMGLLGSSLQALGIEIAFTQAAVVLAVAFVSSPFYLRAAIAAFESLDEDLIDAARSLGAGSVALFARVALPMSRAALAAGSALAFARGLGEFGATIIFAGSLPGVTQTLPLAVYAELDRDLTAAIALSVLLVAVSAAVLVVLRAAVRWRRW